LRRSEVGTDNKGGPAGPGESERGLAVVEEQLKDPRRKESKDRIEDRHLSKKTESSKMEQAATGRIDQEEDGRGRVVGFEKRRGK
jgi:hypothetical protein